MQIGNLFKMKGDIDKPSPAKKKPRKPAWLAKRGQPRRDADKIAKLAKLRGKVPF